MRLSRRARTSATPAQVWEVLGHPSRWPEQVSVVVEGLFTRAAAVPLWLAGAMTLRLLVARAERIARAARPAA